MKAFIIDRYDKKGEMRLGDADEPTTKDDEVLVEVHAAGLNLLDSKVKSGEFKLILPYKFPLILGHDLAGVVVQVGKSVRNFKVGDQVHSRPSDGHIGTFAERIAVAEKDLAHKPANLSMEEAASLPLVALTAWQSLVELGGVKKGQRVFIQAGSGGVGTVAIQLAKHRGAMVATTAGAASFEFLKTLGADVLIDYNSQDFESILDNYDFVLNSQDTRTLEKSLNILRPGGQVVSISGPPTAGLADQVGANWLVKAFLGLSSSSIRRKAKRRKVQYSFLFMQASGAQLGGMTSLFEAGIIKPVIDKVFPFRQANQALAYVESGRAKGKVVLKIK